MPGSRSAGIPAKKASKAAKPPAEAPIPTMGKAAARPEESSGAVWRDTLVRLFFNRMIFAAAPPSDKGQLAPCGEVGAGYGDHGRALFAWARGRGREIRGREDNFGGSQKASGFAVNNYAA